MTNKNPHPAPSQNVNFDLGRLLHPAQAFLSPQEVVNDPELTLDEKRAVLAAWASDACAVEATPSLRQAPGAQRSVPFDDIFEALAELDEKAHELNALRWAKRQIRRDTIELLRSRRSGRSDSPDQQTSSRRSTCIGHHLHRRSLR